MINLILDHSMNRRKESMDLADSLYVYQQYFWKNKIYTILVIYYELKKNYFILFQKLSIYNDPKYYLLFSNEIYFAL
jgi:hypothetical protein